LALPFGRLLSRLASPRNFVALGITILAVGAAYLAITDHLVQLMVASALLGIGHLMFTIGGQSMVARRSRAMQMDANFGWFTAASRSVSVCPGTSQHIADTNRSRWTRSGRQRELGVMGWCASFHHRRSRTVHTGHHSIGEHPNTRHCGGRTSDQR